MENHLYTPSNLILERYAQVLVNYALNSGDGVKPGEVVQCTIPDVAKPLALALQNVILKAGAHPMIRIVPTGFESSFYKYANDDQLQFFPQDYWKARVKLIDHSIGILADVNPDDLKHVDPKKIFKVNTARNPYRTWIFEKESHGKFTWTAGLWGVPAKAEAAGLSLKAYWQQIIKACFLDEKDSVAKWRDIQRQQQIFLDKLNQLPIKTLHVQGPDVDLQIAMGEKRRWNGGSGRNIPSFEIFTSPDWRGTSGWIQFNQPLYRYGHVLRGISLEFADGKVVRAKAEVGQKFLREMIKTPNADKIGEYSLTDKRFSRITHFMAETLFDENMGGKYGNTHLALGMSYKDCYNGDCNLVKPEEWLSLGFNDSVEHTDIISTTDRTVTATLVGGGSQVIYRDGMFVI